ncbi:unnamed protein product [Didymodactylos carnosus]|uniref:Uncharacterized protein n=1 Tax=Didymodactylos carnosus TaxID=1234261 RepID=A0A8S2E7L8_9BILA|nr:unnamed protein product [Didymodactylos carnosus]CAF3916845.1 unnamed protein product [Didymodactylos carnosus]
MLPKDPAKKKLIIKAIAESVGLLPTSAHQRVSRTLSPKAKDAILLLYGRDDISYQMPGKRDTVVVKEDGSKKTYQKRILLYNLRELYQIFLNENPSKRAFSTDLNIVVKTVVCPISGVDVSRSLFAQLRPQQIVVKSSMAHRVCVCLYHENVNLLLNALSKHINGLACSSLRAFTGALVCDEANEQCMLSNCNKCDHNFELQVKSKVIGEAVKIKWSQWDNNKGRAEKTEHDGTVKQCVQLLSTKVKQYLYHVFIKRQQSHLFEQLKEDCDDRTVVVQVDYAENFALGEQDAIQSARWSTKTISIFTAHAWCGALNFSFALPSNNVSHDKYCVSTCISFIIGELKQYLPELAQIIFFSDGVASQFKQRFLFRNLARMSNEHDLKLLWNFFATSHGKRVVDGIGGTVKRMVWQEMMTKRQCKTAADFVRLAKSKTNTIILCEMAQGAIAASEQKPKQLFDGTKAVRNTQKLHNVIAVRQDVIECRSFGGSTSF